MGLGSAGGCALGDEGRLALLGAAPARELEHVSDDGLRRRPATGALAAEHDRRAALRADHERVVLGARARERMAGLEPGGREAELDGAPRATARADEPRDPPGEERRADFLRGQLVD